MEISSSYINNIAMQGASLEKLSSAMAINSASDDASSLAIATNLGVQESGLSQTLENMNSGIAMSNIAQSGLSSQKDILENIKTLTLQAMNGTTSQEGREAIKNEINKNIEQYDSITSATTYNGQNLLETAGDTSDDISIMGEDSAIQMSKVDTSSLSDTLKSFMGDFSTSRASMEGLLDAVDNGQNELASFQSDFASSSNAMESNARNALSEQTNIASAKSTILDIDYGKAMGDFSKSNILSQIGTIVQSQANAVQMRNISLLT